MNNEDNFYSTIMPDASSSFSKLFETDEEKIIRLEVENKQLHEELSIERSARYTAERRNEELQQQIIELQQPKKRKRRTKKEMEAEEDKEYCEFKSDGKRKSRPAEPIRSYDDFVSIQNYF